MPRNHVTAKLIERICPCCAKPFTRRLWQQRVYCSRSCKARAVNRLPNPSTPIGQRFWANVDKTLGHGPQGTCWVWTACAIKGYGYISRTLAHRVSWEIHNSPIPEGLCVLHKCDNPPCVNPEHLFLGTKKDNILDAVAKGRWIQAGGRTARRQ